MAVQYLRVISAFLAVLLLASPVTAAETANDHTTETLTEVIEPIAAQWTIAGGYFDILEGSGAAQLQLEYRGDYYWARLRPAAGITVDNEGGLFAYGGGYLEIPLSETWHFSPHFVTGAYFDGGSKPLGSTIQFRSGLELGYEFEHGHHIGISFTHISNAGLGSKNPGAESLMVVYGWPISL